MAEDPSSIANVDYAAAICIWSGDIGLAHPAAAKLLEMEGDRSGYSRGYARHKGHTHLGRIALAKSNVAGAVDHLLSSGNTTPSATMTSFGPNMALARGLLAAGETEPVLAYLQTCGEFWNKPQVETWSAQIRRGEIPDFGANLNY